MHSIPYHNLFSDELSRQITDCNAKYAFTTSELYEKLQEAINQTNRKFEVLDLSSTTFGRKL